MAFRILSVFQTLHDFDEAFEAYRNSTYSTFAISTSAKTPNKINYNYCVFKCIHFEDPEKKLAKTKSVGKRPKQQYIKPTNCPAYFRLFRRPDGTYQITKFNDKHEGHELNEELFKHLPRQKRLTDDERKTVLDMMDNGGSAMLVAEYIRTNS